LSDGFSIGNGFQNPKLRFSDVSVSGKINVDGFKISLWDNPPVGVDDVSNSMKDLIFSFDKKQIFDFLDGDNIGLSKDLGLQTTVNRDPLVGCKATR